MIILNHFTPIKYQNERAVYIDREILCKSDYLSVTANADCTILSDNFRICTLHIQLFPFMPTCSLHWWNYTTKFYCLMGVHRMWCIHRPQTVYQVFWLPWIRPFRYDYFNRSLSENPCIWISKIRFVLEGMFRIINTGKWSRWGSPELCAFAC